MEVIGPGLGDHVNHSAGGASNLSRIVVGLNCEFRNGIYRRAHTETADDALIVVDPINQLIVDDFGLPIDRDGRCLTPVIRAVTARQAISWASVRSWNLLGKLNEVTAVERKILDRLRSYRAAERGTVGLK